MRTLDANGYEYDVSGSDERTEYIDLQTPRGRYPTIEQVWSKTDEHTGWTITFDARDSEEPRMFTVRSIA